MSCENCDKFQDTKLTSYYRWKNANIEIRGCEKHLKEIFDILNESQKSRGKIPADNGNNK